MVCSVSQGGRARYNYEALNRRAAQHRASMSEIALQRTTRECITSTVTVHCIHPGMSISETVRHLDGRAVH